MLKEVTKNERQDKVTKDVGDRCWGGEEQAGYTGVLRRAKET